MASINANASIWRGSLLSLFWVQFPDGARQCVKATADGATSLTNTEKFTLRLCLSDVGTGSLDVGYYQEAFDSSARASNG